MPAGLDRAGWALQTLSGLLVQRITRDVVTPGIRHPARANDSRREHKSAHSRRLAALLLRVDADAAQMRWNTSTPRTLRPAKKAFPVATTVVGLTKRPDQFVVTLQSDVQVLDV
jgi:hypothetical protein